MNSQHRRAYPDNFDPFMSRDIERKMDEFGANIRITPQSSGLSMNYGGISLGVKR